MNMDWMPSSHCRRWWVWCQVRGGSERFFRGRYGLRDHNGARRVVRLPPFRFGRTWSRGNGKNLHRACTRISLVAMSA